METRVRASGSLLEFGDSKVVGIDGRLLVVYHGTNVDFDNFEIFPAFFTPDPEAASAYALDHCEATMDCRMETAPNVRPAFLRIERPLMISALDLIDEIGGDKTISRPEWAHFDDWFFAALTRGHDGVRIVGGADYVGMVDGHVQRKVYDQWAVGSPDQIKSAIGHHHLFEATISVTAPPGTPTGRHVEHTSVPFKLAPLATIVDALSGWVQTPDVRDLFDESGESGECEESIDSLRERG